MTNAITGDYDVVVQVQESVINNIFGAMHAAGAVSHRALLVHQDQRVDLQIGRPSIVLLPTSPADHSASALVNVRILLQLRPLADASALGTVRVARITVRAALSCVPGKSNQPTSINYDWARTTAADILLAGSPDDPGLRDMLATVISRISGTNPTGITNNVAFRFLPGTPGTLVSIGADRRTADQGTWDQLKVAFLGAKDWALALGRDYFLGKIRGAMEARWRELPPPYGSTPVLISDQVVCTIKVADNCLDHARRRVYLDRFEVSLSPGAIVFSGTARAVTGAWYIPDVSANFSFSCSVSVDTNQQLTLAVTASTVDFTQWYSEVFDWFTFGALQQVVITAFRSALLSDQARQDFSALVSSSVIGNLASLGKSVNICAIPRADSVAILPDAVIFSGSIAIPDNSLCPVVDLIVLRRDCDPDIRMFEAGGSWAPGGDLAEIDWNFGDGSAVIQRGDDARLAAEHRYLPGEYVASLRVLDRAGRSSSCSALIRVGIMSLGCASRVIERTRSPVSMTFNVTKEGAPLCGVTVTVSAGGWQTVGTTGQEGSVSILIDPLHFVALPEPYAVDGWWATHYVNVTAVKTGYRSETLTLLLADRMLELRGDSIVRPSEPVNLKIGVFQQDTPVARAEVVITGKAKWQTRQVTPADGWAQCVVDGQHFIELSEIVPMANGFNATGYILVDASKTGYHPALQKKIYRGYILPDYPIYKELRRKFEKWWLWSVELTAAIDRGDLLDPDVISSLPDISVAISALKGVFDLQASRTVPILSVADLLGVSGGNEEGVFRRIEALSKTLEQKLAPLQDTARRAHKQIEPTHPRPRIRPVEKGEHWPKRQVSERWRERSERLLATAEVVARLRPLAADLPARCRELLILLGHIGALERLPSRIMPATELLGTRLGKLDESPSERIETLLMMAQKNVEATANEHIEIPR